MVVTMDTGLLSARSVARASEERLMISFNSNEVLMWTHIFDTVTEKLRSMFGATYICESVFLTIDFIENNIDIDQVFLIKI